MLYCAAVVSPKIRVVVVCLTKLFCLFFCQTLLFCLVVLNSRKHRGRKRLANTRYGVWDIVFSALLCLACETFELLVQFVNPRTCHKVQALRGYKDFQSLDTVCFLVLGVPCWDILHPAQINLIAPGIPNKKRVKQIMPQSLLNEGGKGLILSQEQNNLFSQHRGLPLT